MKRIINSKAAGWIVAAGLAAILFFEFNGKKNTFTKKNVPHDTVDTVYKYKKSSSSSNNTTPKEILRVDTFYRDIDTLNILKDYFATKKYLDTVIMSNGTVIISEHISENAIKLRKLDLITKEVEITKQTTLFEKPRNKVFIGTSLMFDKLDAPSSFSIDGVFIPKSDRSLYTIGYDPINKRVRLGAAIKISIKKEKEFEKR